MSWFSSLKQQVFDGARGLFDQQQQTLLDGAQKQQPQNTLGRFGIFNFGNDASAANDAGALKNLSAAVEVTDPPQTDKGNDYFKIRISKPPTGQTSDPIAKAHTVATDAADQIIKQIGFTAPEIDAYKAKHNNQDPRADIANIINRCLIDPRCEKTGFDKPLKAGQEIGIYNIPRSVTAPLRDFLKTERTAQKEVYDQKIQKLKDNATGLIARDTAKEIGETVKKNVPTVLATTTAGLGTAADLVLHQPLPLPQIADIAKNVRLVVGSAAGVAEAAPPIAFAGTMIAGAKATIEQQTTQKVGEKLDDIARHNRERILEMPLPPLQMTMDDAEPPPLARPTDTAERPKPKVTDLPNAPTDLVPTGNAKPQVQPQAKPEADAKPETKVDDLPQPYTPDAPRNNQPQQQPPQMPKLPKGVPEIITGAATATIGKTAADMAKQDVAPNGVQKINKREWSETEYKQWFDNLPKSPAKTASDANIYQLIQVGDTEFTISGNGEKFDADGLADKTVLEAKFVGKPARSPYIEDSKLPPFLRDRIDGKTRGEFARLSVILRDNNNPLTAVRVITSDEKAVPYFEKLMREYNVPGEVIIRKEKDIEP